MRHVLSTRYSQYNGDTPIVTGGINPVTAPPSNVAFQLLYQVADVEPGLVDEVDRFWLLTVDSPHCAHNVLLWWDGKKLTLPFHYKMAMDYLGVPATPCE